MPTTTFTIAADANDGCGYRRGSSWATITTAAYTDAPFGNTLVSVSKTFNSGSSEFWVLCGYLRWDTSSLPDDAIISAASLKLFVDGKGDPDGVSYAADFFDYGGSPSDSGDWEQTSAGGAITSFTEASLTVGIVNTIALTGFSGISLSGFTGIRIAPTNTTQPTDDNFVDFAANEHATGAPPQLEVTYSQSVAGVANRYLTRHSRMTSW